MKQNLIGRMLKNMIKLDSLINFLGWIMLFIVIALCTLFLTVSILGFIEGFTIAWKETY